jgi:nuclear protein 1
MDKDNGTEGVGDQYEHYNYDADKYANSGHSGKQRTKKEVAGHSNHADPSGHTRKIQTKLENTEKNRKNSGGK